MLSAHTTVDLEPLPRLQARAQAQGQEQQVDGQHRVYGHPRRNGLPAMHVPLLHQELSQPPAWCGGGGGGDGGGGGGGGDGGAASESRGPKLITVWVCVCVL
jgi:hypothetical protein